MSDEKFVNSVTVTPVCIFKPSRTSKTCFKWSEKKHKSSA